MIYSASAYGYFGAQNANTWLFTGWPANKGKVTVVAAGSAAYKAIADEIRAVTGKNMTAFKGAYWTFHGSGGYIYLLAPDGGIAFSSLRHNKGDPPTKAAAKDAGTLIGDLAAQITGAFTSPYKDQVGIKPSAAGSNAPITFIDPSTYLPTTVLGIQPQPPVTTSGSSGSNEMISPRAIVLVGIVGLMVVGGVGLLLFRK